MMDVFRNLPSSTNLCFLSQHGWEKENIYLRTGDQWGKQKLCISRILNHKTQIFEYMVSGLKLHQNFKCRCIVCLGDECFLSNLRVLQVIGIFQRRVYAYRLM